LALRHLPSFPTRRSSDLGLAVSLPIFAWPEILKRDTTMDFLARGLERYAQPEDLIVVNPWFLAPSFGWYYHGQVHWMTVPELSRSEEHTSELQSPCNLVC